MPFENYRDKLKKEKNIYWTSLRSRLYEEITKLPMPSFFDISDVVNMNSLPDKKMWFYGQTKTIMTRKDQKAQKKANPIFVLDNKCIFYLIPIITRTKTLVDTIVTRIWLARSLFGSKIYHFSNETDFTIPNLKWMDELQREPLNIKEVTALCKYTNLYTLTVSSAFTSNTLSFMALL